MDIKAQKCTRINDDYIICARDGIVPKQENIGHKPFR